MREYIDIVEEAQVSAEVAVLSDMMTRADPKPFEEWFASNGDEEAKDDPEMMLWEFSYYIKDELSLDVDEDGRISFYGLTRESQKLIGDHPVKLYHFTSNVAAEGIKTHGLTSDNKSVNRTSTPGVYLTSEYGGPATDGYHRNAVNALRGKARDTAYGVVVTVWMYLNELSPDPDDSDISSGRHQFICDHVPPERIVSIDRA